jgi:hypothetical protein
VGPGDVRVRDALALLESKRAGDGGWHVEGRWWRSPGSRGSNVEAVDWSSTADRLLTGRAHSVLSAATNAVVGRAAGDRVWDQPSRAALQS